MSVSVCIHGAYISLFWGDVAEEQTEVETAVGFLGDSGLPWWVTVSGHCSHVVECTGKSSFVAGL